MRTVKEVSKLTGVSVRTLHYYDAIGLLKPTTVTEAGYRLYDDTAMERLQQILLFRELAFPLKEIKQILESPGFDRGRALAQQIDLLVLKKERLENLINLAREIKITGVNKMNFKAFDTSKIDEYAAEAKHKWGSTDAYQEYERKAKGQNTDADDLMQFFEDMGKIKHLPPDSDDAKKAIKALQQFITERYYTCTPQILAGLGQMYICDERFRQNIDTCGGTGIAEFVSKAIEVYCITDKI